ncbi:peptidylprolyl isomerase [Candidatus Shapirobacteria bacterium]|nr:peptidylprolyl isomerase [Candidatus Shapirobacteria bacterium]
MKILIVLFSLLFLSSCSLKSSSKISPTPTMIPQTPISATPSATNTNTDSVVALKTKNGQIVIKLYQSETPKTVDNFLKKVNSGFYNGLTFHRVIEDFMAQGGDPTGTGSGGGQQASEINQIPFKRGSLGLARTPVSKEISNDSQFFICFSTPGCQHLTGDYVNFGEVISGLEVLDQIKQGDKIIEITTKTK